MRLKRLVISGFKSFADRTIFDFGEGLTVFVGPNGCGKSNVVDAVKWVLGEQSAKSLRGSEMMDVIFNGAAGRKPGGYAEVSLTLENTKGLLDIEYSEVCVTRRLFRSGESEYLVNRNPARLKDIRDLFLDTGIGMSAYSFMEQGKVDILLHSNSRDRRLIFEEAAGISKYKIRKRQAATKLERVEANLLRVGDVLSEVEKRIVSVKRQAAKARRYKACMDELRTLRIRLSSEEFYALKDKHETAGRRLSDLEAETEQERLQFEEVDAKVHAIEADVIDQENRMAQLRSRLDLLRTQSDADAQQIERNQRWLSQMDDTVAKLQDELATYHEHLTRMRDEAETVSVQLRTTKEQNIQDETVLDALMRAEQNLARELKTGAQELEHLNTSLLDAMRRETSTSNDLVRLESEFQSLEGRKARRMEHETDLTKDAEGIALVLDQMREEAEEFGHALARLKADRQDTLHRAEGLSRQLTQAEMRRDDISKMISRKEIRIGTLDALEKNREGLNQGVVSLLDSTEHDRCHLARVYGIVGQILHVPMRYVKAVEAALGEDVQAVVMETREDALRAIQYLAAENKGYATIYPRRVAIPGPRREMPPHLDGVVGVAADIVEHPKNFQALLEMLLGHTLIVRDREIAIGIDPVIAGRWRIVTVQGEVFAPTGGIRGGGGSEKLGIISRRAEIDQLDRELRDLRKDMEAVMADLEKHSLEKTELEMQERDHRVKIYELSIQWTDRQKEIRRKQEEQCRLREEVELIHKELTVIDAEVRSAVAQQEKLSSYMEQCKHQIAALRREIGMCEKTIAGNRAKLESVKSDIAEQRVKMTEHRERTDSLTQQSKMLEGRKQEYHQHLVKVRSELESVAHRRRQAEQENAQARENIVHRKQEMEQSELEIADRNTSREEAVRQLRVHQERASRLRAAMEGNDEQIHQYRLEKQEYLIKMQHLMQRIAEDYAVNLDEVIPEKEQSTEAQRKAWRDKIDELRLRIDRMGNVNLNAIDELESLEQEHGTLKRQEQDVLKAVETLHRVINEINRTSRDLFDATFARIRANFQEMFRKFFGGGRADVFLSEGEDVLEAGIEIIAKPPGKEPQSISLLSGGEKALTAVAMLFAIFKTHPSPFCFLDEVDAPLDDSNVGRFAKILQEFLADSQFLMITHNKQSMGIADVMYGITQPTPGISRKISVKIKEQAEPLTQEVA